jgi:hypothetical protein
VRERTSGRSLAQLAVRCHDSCGDDTIRHKSCYYRWSNAVAFQSHPRRVLFSSHAILRHHGDPSYIHHSYSCGARGAELLLPNHPSRQCHHLTLTAYRPAIKHLAVTTYTVDRWTITIHEIHRPEKIQTPPPFSISVGFRRRSIDFSTLTITGGGRSCPLTGVSRSVEEVRARPDVMIT